ncbi:hypothetical protein F4677DRAFT_462401 [Hypoxylon crocopeplum]|nr:hypothetical protein F4677DRAFT_462401 [Hypoxylon crocopeplum]
MSMPSLIRISLLTLLFSGLAGASKHDRWIAPSTTSTLPRQTRPASPIAIPAKDDAHIGIWRDTEHLSPSQLEQRGQFVFVFCPETFQDGLPKPCDKCGGDSRVSGQCDRVLLTGDQELCPFPGKVTSITTVNGQAGTVVWEPKTIAEYSRLRASTTATFTDLVDSTDGESELATVVAVVVAGGIAWWAASQNGAAVAIAAISPPSELPGDGRGDDERCKKDPKEDCQDCGGGDNLKLCISGPELGCPCDENQHCPDEPPRCTEPQCGGDNGRSQCSTSGSINGCTCCLDGDLDCTNADCNGNEDLFCQGQKFAGCGCLFFGKAVALDPQWEGPGRVSEDQLYWQASQVFAIAWSANYDLAPGYDIPKPSSCPPESYTPITAHPDASKYTFLKPTMCYCMCGPTMTPLNWGTNGVHSITSWCMQGTKVPDGWSSVSKTDCEPTYILSSTSITSSSATSTSATTELSNTPTTTADDCDWHQCGSPYQPLCCYLLQNGGGSQL